MHKFFKVIASILFCTVIATQSFAQNSSSAPPVNEMRNVTMRLVPEKTTIVPGETIWVGIEQSIRDHWHTYWQNPGDSGASPRITWDLPSGFDVSEIYWPTPKKLPYEPLLNYGYEDNVILLQKITAPETLPNGALNLSAQVDILVCKVECIPEFDTLSLTLNGVSSDADTQSNDIYLKKAQAKLPVDVDWPASYRVEGQNVVFTITPTIPLINQDVALFPLDWGLIDNAAAPTVSFEDGQLTITQMRGNRALDDIGDMDAVIAVGQGDQRLGYALNIQMQGGQKAAIITPDSTHAVDAEGGMGLFLALILAFLGGVILNLMPCVFPVLSLKALGLVKTAQKNPGKVKISGLLYLAGVLVTFTVIAVAILVLKAAGSQIGWGFQLQNPVVVGGLAYLLFIIALNLFGFFEFGTSLTNIGSGKTTKDSGVAGSFWTGVLATIVATPCTAPFMAGAIGYAFIQPPLVSLLIFWVLGLGLAAPYLLLTFTPHVGRYLPKPGAWMETFKQAMAFPILLSAAWLVWVLAKQSGSMGVLLILIGFVVIGLSVWLANQRFKIKTIWSVLLIIGALALLIFIPSHNDTTPSDVRTGDNWEQSYSVQSYDKALQGQDPVFVEMTAAWCITCKVNHATSINIESTRKLFDQENVTFLVGDWTNQDDSITQYLKKYGRSGVPLYVFYGKPNAQGVRPEPIVLPQILTPGLVKKAVSGE